MPKRRYGFELPYHIGGMILSFGLPKYQAMPQYQDVPADLRQRLEDGAGVFSGGATVTAADLDRIPDSVWEPLAAELDLKWSKAK